MTNDFNSSFYLSFLHEKEKLEANRLKEVKTVLVVLSASAMVFDVEGIRQKISMVYPDTAVFFRTTSGKPMGVASPEHVDLLVDLTGPGQRQFFLYAKALRRMSRFAVGRNAGFFRKSIYNRIFDEKSKNLNLPKDTFQKERVVQATVLGLIGVPMIPIADVTADRGKVIALELPPLLQR